MKYIKKFILLMVICVFVLSACAKPQETETPKAEETTEAKTAEVETAEVETTEEKTPEDKYIKVKIGLDSDPAALSPWLGVGVQGRTAVLQSVYEAMFSQEKFGGEVVPVIASGYEKIDNVTYHVTIRDDVYDSAGNQITASDVVFSFQTAKELGNMATFLGSYAGISLVDEFTVELVLTSNDLGAFDNTVVNVDIISQAAYEKNADGFVSNPIGTGPYIVKSFTPGSGAILVKNETYWQGDNPTNLYGHQYADEIEYKVITEPSQVAIALETGEIDFATNVARSDLYLFEGSEDFQIVNVPEKLTNVVLYNNSSESPCQDINLRKAISYAIDPQAIIDGVYLGKGDIIKTYGSPSYIDYVEKWDDEEYFPYDVAKAKEYLAMSSYAGETLVIMTVPGDFAKVSEIIQAYLTEVGINSEIKSYEMALYNTYRFDPTQWDILPTNKGSGDYLANIWKYSYDARLFKGATQTFLADPQLQTLLEACLNVETHNDESMDAFHQYLKETVTARGLFRRYTSFVANAKIENVVLNHMNVMFPGASTYSDDFGN
jgi:ABC-type transport system substrate-binding protein